MNEVRDSGWRGKRGIDDVAVSSLMYIIFYRVDTQTTLAISGENYNRKIT